MCVQFISKCTLADLIAEFGAEAAETFEWKPHVFPRYAAPVFVQSQGKLSIKKMQFGLIPFFEKNEKPKMVFHNARVETITEKPSFKGSFVSKRCAIPLNSFFEYIWEDEKNKWIANFSEAKDRTLLAAGVWNAWQSPSGRTFDTFTMITREPPPLIRETGHDRSPFFIRPSEIHQWVDEKTSDSRALLQTLSQIAVEPEFRLSR